jgi:RNA polymerase sigma-70 factor (ECF subfamily)
VEQCDDAALAQDRRLVARMAGGDDEALRELYGRHVDRIYGIAARILRDREEVREVVQDTFARAWNLAGRYRAERGEVVAWLVFMARNGAIDRIRRSGRRERMLAICRADAADDASPDGWDDGREWLERQLGLLSRDQRRALELAFFQGCTQAEIAERIGTSVGNVKNHLRRGLMKLRRLVRP